MYNATHYPSFSNYFIKGEMSDNYKKRMEKSTGQSFTQAHRKQPKRYLANRMTKGSKNFPGPNNYFKDTLLNKVRDPGYGRSAYTIRDKRQGFKKDITPAPDRYRPNVAFIT